MAGSVLGMTPYLLALVALAIGTTLGWLVARRRPVGAPEHADVRVLDGLARLDERMRDLEHQRVAWQSQLRQQVEDVRLSADELRRETHALGTALRRPHVRGRWGELHLRRSVELAGMVEHVDFHAQVSHAGPDGWQRPDLVVRLAGGASVVVDAKVPLEAFLDAGAASDPEEQQAHLTRHARQLRRHVDQLSGKAYWRAQEQTPEFVVLFLPAESILSAALEAEPGLLEHAAVRKVVVATPTTLIALLRTVSHGWTTQALAERTREIHELGRELYERLGTASAHLDKLGRSLATSVEAFNSHVGSLESRVLVTARHFADVAEHPEPLPMPSPVEAMPRPITAPELHRTG